MLRGRFMRRLGRRFEDWVVILKVMARTGFRHENL